MIGASHAAAARSGAGFGAIVRPRTGVGRVARALLQVAAFVAIGGLVAFHGWLLWDRLVGGDLLEPGVALRWGGAALLVGALAGLRHLGAPVLRGRPALVIWLLVALLHWSIPASSPETTAPSPSPSSVIFVLPTTAAAGLAGLTLLLAALGAGRRPAPAFSRLCTVEPSPASRLLRGWRRGGASRAPPLACA